MKKSFLFIIISILSVALILTACSKDTTDTTIVINNNPNNEDKENIDKNIDNADDEKEDEQNSNLMISSLDGLKYDKKLLENRPIAISIDNHPRARWQAGISDAHIVYEVEAEGTFTRYVAIFQAIEPKIIGPVRSARPYMIDIALGYDSIFAHVGGSNDAFFKIKQLAVADVDGLYTSNMWRYSKTGKYAPHNVYTDLESLRKDAATKGYREEFKFDGLSFNENDSDIDIESSQSAKKVNIVFNKFNSTEYVYDDNTKCYNRIKDGENHIDENNEKQITAKNILICNVTKKVLDNEGRLFLGVVGQGSGYYITNGKVIEITWEKPTEKSETVYKVNDKVLKLNPGNTWIEIASQNTQISFE